VLELSRSRRTDGEAMNIRIKHPRYSRRGGYVPPSEVQKISLNDALARGHRSALDARQMDLLHGSAAQPDTSIYCAGNLKLLSNPAVSIVGTREVSEEGRVRAKRLARELVASGIVVVSGLARGIDAAAHGGAIEANGRTIAVIGTPLDKAYPAENAELQMEIYQHHLLVSPFREGETTFRSNFPKRNRVMAAISDATVIVEASDTSGTLHQAAECQRLGRWLFIAKSVVNDPSLTWPSRFLGKTKVAVLSSTNEILDALRIESR
jgi:DNA processing protein